MGRITGNQGYAQGRLIFDIALFLETTGGLKSLISQWKRTKTFKIKDYLPQKTLTGVVKESGRYWADK